jgi:hypothetical protein
MRNQLPEPESVADVIQSYLDREILAKKSESSESDWTYRENVLPSPLSDIRALARSIPLRILVAKYWLEHATKLREKVVKTD